MKNTLPYRYQSTSDEMIMKLINAGYLSPGRRNDPNAISSAIGEMKQDLRGPRRRDDGPQAA
jgi:hypothetical protein